MSSTMSSPGVWRAARVLAISLSILTGLPAAAQDTLTAAPQPVFVLRGFEVRGPNPLDEGQTRRVLAPFARTDASLETLQQASAALEAALRERGFGLYRVVVPPQEVGETIVLEVVRFAVNKVEIEGNSRYDARNIRASVPELQEGATPNFKRLAVQTAIANENPNRQLQVALHESPQPDFVDATIHVRESRPWAFGVSASNAGSDATGQDRVTVFGSHGNLFNRDHHFVGAYTTSLERGGDVKQLGLSYRVPLYGAGGVLGATFTRSDVVGDFGAFRSTGAGRLWALNYTHYLPPQGGQRRYLTLAFEDKRFDTLLINGMVMPGQRDRRSRPLTLGYAEWNEKDAAVWRYALALAANTGAGGGNELAAYQSEDPRITTVRWRALRGSASWRMPAGRWLLDLRGQFQWSPDILISGERFGLGGPGSVRGTRQERPIAGDSGVAVTAEMSTPELTRGLRLLGFSDVGWLGHHAPHAADRPASDIIASVGLGLRYTREFLAVSVDYGRLVNGSRVPLSVNSASPKAGDERFYINMTVRF